MKQPVVYLAHPVGAPTVEGIHGNLARARRWYWWLRKSTGWSISCPWMCEVIACLESGASEAEERHTGIENMCAQVERCDAILLVGGRVSAGMEVEAYRARAVVDVTDVGEEPPAPGSDSEAALLQLLRREMAAIIRA